MDDTMLDAADLADQATAALVTDPRVAAARVVAAADAALPSLLGWVVPAAEWMAAARQKAGAGQARTAVKLWARVFDTAYFAAEADAPKTEAPGPSYAGWSSSLTGAPMPAAEMELYLAHTVERILALRPRHVLEVGCGLGLLLQRIAPRCASYRATDISAEAIGRLQAWASRQDGLRHAELAQRAAHELDDLPTGAIDTVIINSVVQYFPDSDYLERVLLSVAPLLTPDGRVFVGDVRDVRLQDAFNAAVALARAEPGETAGGLRRALHRRNEPELAIDPAAFAALPGYGSARTLLKHAGADNEMTRYRYDVVLCPAADPSAPVVTRAWDTTRSLPARAAVDDAALLLRDIPNARVLTDLRAAHLIQQAPAAYPAAALRIEFAAEPQGEDPSALVRAAERLGHRAEALCGATAGRFDLLLSDPAAAPPAPPAVARDVQPASDPLLARLGAPLLAALREALAAQLPAAEGIALTAIPALPYLG